MDSFIYSLNATVPIFLIMILGNLMKRAGIIDLSFCRGADKLVFRICLPCLLFLNLADTDIRKNFDFKYVGFCFFVTLISIVSIWILAKIFLKDKTSVGAFVQGSYRSSAAILGIAFIENIYGSSEMAPLMILGAVPLYNVFAVFILTLESRQYIEQGHQIKDKGKLLKKKIKAALLGVLLNPIILGIFAGFLVSFFRIPVFPIVEKTLSKLGTFASTLALLSIGVSFEGKKAIAKIKPTVIASFLKLLGLTAAALPLAVWFGFRDQKLLALIIMLASPCTPTAYIMTRNMDGDDVLASSIIVVTTFFSSITLTFWIFLVRSLGYI